MSQNIIVGHLKIASYQSCR